MASSTPPGAATGDGLPAYLSAWAALTELLRGGSSWSGHERNVCFLNRGDGTFVDASWLSGFDFADDGRAAAVTDQDGDGDLDLWLRNRTSPQLRFLRNTGPAGPALVLELEGRTSNRDAIGAVVHVRGDHGEARRDVVAGDGYLSQSSRRLVFPLAEGEAVHGVRVRWPGGVEEPFAGIDAPGRYRLIQGSGTATPLATAWPDGGRTVAPPAEAGGDGRVLLRLPLPLPPSFLAPADPAHGRATLLHLWAHWCEPCLGELEVLRRDHAAIRDAGIDLVAFSVDAPEDRARAAAVLGESPPFAAVFADAAWLDTLDAVLDHVLRARGELTLPTSLLVDREGRLQMIYLGPVTTPRVLEDHRRWVFDPPPAHLRSLTHGRWYFRVPRDFDGLAADLASRGRSAEARFYLEAPAR